MKPIRKNDLIDKAEIIDDPTKKYGELAKINEEIEKVLDIENNLISKLEQFEKNLSRNFRMIKKLLSLIQLLVLSSTSTKSLMILIWLKI